MEVKQLFDLLRKEAECSFCIHQLNNPKTLPCLHSFCLDCLNKYAASRRQQGHTTFNCPECLATFQVPDNDKFDAFQTAFHQNRLLDILALEKRGQDQQKSCDNCDENVAASSYCFECQTFLCETCLNKHNGEVTRAHRQTSLQNLQTADVEALTQGPVLCDKQYHEREPLEYYCEDCRVCICRKCVVEHNKHSLLDILRVAEQHKRQIIKDVEQMKYRISECEQEIEKSKKSFETIEQQIEEARHKAEATVEELIRDLKEHEGNIMRELNEIHQTQRQAHLAQLKNFELSLAQLNSAIEYAEAIMTRDMGPEILRTQEDITQRCDKLLTDQKITPHKPVRVGLVTNDELCQTVRQSVLGRVDVSLTDLSRSVAGRSIFKRRERSGGLAHASYSVAEGEGLQKAQCGERAEFTVIKKDAKGKQSYSWRDKVTVHIQTAAQEELEVKIKNKKNGTYHVTYVPQKHGQHHVIINMNKKPLTESPWNIYVTPHQYQAISSFSSRGTGEGQFNGPYAISVSSTGNIAVADRYSKRVQVFTSEGEYLREFGHGVLKWPVSVVYTSPDHIIVVDVTGDEKSKAMMFTESGTCHKQFSPVHLKSPRGVSVTNDGRVVVCDWSDKAVKVLSPNGETLLQSFTAAECSTSPHCAIYYKEKFFVSYRWIHCIKVFDATGKYLQDIGCQGTGDGQFQHPLSLAIDKFGDLFVVDVDNNRLQVFTVEGEFVSKTAGQGTELGQFDTPIDVAVSQDGRVYVTDFKNSRVQIFV